jgi:phosphoserine aminotransferase
LARKDADIIFTQNGTTSGVKVPHFNWISDDREGVVINDATSACFAQAIDWNKCDVVTFSWQKALGGEASHGMIVLSPRAVDRLESFTAPRPLPKIFRMTKKGKLDEALFDGATINTPSLLCVEDWLDALAWADEQGGLIGLIARADANADIIADWVARTDWVDLLAEAPETRSNTSVCLKVVDPAVTALDDEGQAAFAKQLAGLLEKEGVALDAGSYRAAPPGLRIWCGATIEMSDLEALTPWLDWAFEECAANLAKAA